MCVCVCEKEEMVITKAKKAYGAYASKDNPWLKNNS